MNKTLRNVITGAALVFMTTGCASKCEFDEYKEAFNAARKDAPRVEKIEIKGTYNGKTYEFSSTSDEKLSAENAAVFAAYETYNTLAWGMSEIKNSNATYYAGSTFKIETDKVTYKLDKYGYVTYVQDGDNVELKASISYKK